MDSPSIFNYNRMQIPIYPKKGMKRITIRNMFNTFRTYTDPRFELNEVKDFIKSRKDWMDNQLLKWEPDINTFNRKWETNPDCYLRDYSRNELRTIIEECVDKYSVLRGRPNKIFIRSDMIRNWGTCSAKNNITFNIQMRYLPKHLIDYIVYHEMCHFEEKKHNLHFYRMIREVYLTHMNEDNDLNLYGYRITNKQLEDEINQINSSLLP